VEYPMQEVIKHADLHCMEEEVGLREVTHDTRICQNKLNPR
jgi:hypothetical protein